MKQNPPAKTKRTRRASRANVTRAHAHTNGETPMSDSLSDYVTTKEAAELLGVDRTHINRLRIEGRIRGVQLGHEWLIFRPSLQEYFQNKAPSGKPSSRQPKLTPPK